MYSKNIIIELDKIPGDPRFKDEAVSARTLAEQQDEFDWISAELFEEQERYMKEFGMEKIWYMQWGNTQSTRESNY
jgi:hypothetical protein